MTTALSAGARAAASPAARATKRYVISTGWTHIFLEGRRQVERTTRWVYDRSTKALVVLDIERQNKWREGSRAERDDVLDSLLHGNEGCLDDPSTWDFALSDSVPDWD